MLLQNFVVSFGVVGLACGIIGLVLANKDGKLYQTYPETYSFTSLKTSNAGRICSIIGLIISSLAIIAISIIFLSEMR